MRLLRLPSVAWPLAYGFAHGFRMSRGFVFARRRSPLLPGQQQGLGPFRHRRPLADSPMRATWDLIGFLVSRPVPLPCSKTPAESVDLTCSGRPDAAPVPNKTKASTCT